MVHNIQKQQREVTRKYKAQYAGGTPIAVLDTSIIADGMVSKNKQI